MATALAARGAHEVYDALGLDRDGGGPGGFQLVDDGGVDLSALVGLAFPVPGEVPGFEASSALGAVVKMVDFSYKPIVSH